MNGHTRTMDAITSIAPAFPPSFDNDPWLFGWALFARGLVLLLSSATIVRILSRNRVEDIGPAHPVFYHRMVVLCFCMTAWLASFGDTFTMMLWNEVDGSTMGLMLMAAKVLDGLTIIPFTMALFVPFWMTWLRWTGIVSVQKGAMIVGTLEDLRLTWVSGVVPARLVGLCALTSGLVSVAKYAAWAAHGPL